MDPNSGSGAGPTPYSVGSSGSVVGVKWTVSDVDHFPQLQRIRMSGVTPLLSISDFMSCAVANLPFL
jgi:hypothetical protein